MVAPAHRVIRIDPRVSAAKVLEHAIELAHRFSYPVFPCRQNKQPYTAHGFKNATTNVGQIAEWWRRFPDALIGVPTGRVSGLLTVDVDPHGRRWHAANTNRLHCSRIHETRRGSHLVYRMPNTRISCSAGMISSGVDVRADGGYMIWWPAHGLRAIGDLSHLSLPPEWLIERATSRSAIESSTPTEHSRVPQGTRNEYLSKEAYRLRMQGRDIEQILEVIRALNNTICRPPLPDDELQQIARGKAQLRPDSASNASIELHLQRGSEVEMEPISWL